MRNRLTLYFHSPANSRSNGSPVHALNPQRCHLPSCAIAQLSKSCGCGLIHQLAAGDVKRFAGRMRGVPGRRSAGSGPGVFDNV